LRIAKLHRVITFILAGLLVDASSAASEQPVYIYLFAHVDDHIHRTISEDRLRRTLNLLESLRSESPTSQVSAVIQFSGAMAEYFTESGKASVLANRVKDSAARGAIEIGYRGADEPTPNRRPRPGFRDNRSVNEWWSLRSEGAGRFLNEYKHPLTGSPDPRRSGGLKRVRELFGEVTSVIDVTQETGRDTEFVHQIRKDSGRVIMSGLREPDPTRNLHGYRDAVRTFGAMMSPEPNSSPELYWEDDLLHLSETSDRAVRVLHSYEGVGAAKKVLQELDRSKIHIIQLELASQELNLQPSYAKGLLFPPARFAYDHPDRPDLPPEALRTRAEVDGAYAQEESLLRWLIDEYLPSNPGSSFVSNSDLIRMAEPSCETRIPLSRLRKATTEMLARWGSDTVPPNYVAIEGCYFSLANIFQMLTTALANPNQTGKLPDSVMLSHVYGPEEMTEEAGPNQGQVAAAAVAYVSAVLNQRLQENVWKTVPVNMIPCWTDVGGIRLNAAQLLRLMGEALLARSATAKLDVKLANMFSAVGEMYPHSGSRSDQGGIWTFKPAILRPANLAPKGP
jgi:hypothetical protein